MYDNCIKLIEMPEHNSISVCVYIENDGIFEFGERITEQFDEAYMNGYNWDALITFYVNSVDPDLMAEVDTDPEAGMFSAYMKFSQDNLVKMKRFESHIRTMLADEKTLLKFIADNYEAIEWD
ncbi:MAG: hypothetical protein GY757_05035 [bacterium]|nr:hypothetical protein [bacterium]